MSKKNYKKSRKYKKMRRRKIIFGIEITVLLILSGILFVYAWINRSMDKMNEMMKEEKKNRKQGNS